MRSPISRSSTRRIGSSSIDHCGDTYKVATADGKICDFWERNLRFKTDVSDDGPQEGAPAIVPAGMMGDRADVIFASPDEISGFISHQMLRPQFLQLKRSRLTPLKPAEADVFHQWIAATRWMRLAAQAVPWWRRP